MLDNEDEASSQAIAFLEEKAARLTGIFARKSQARARSTKRFRKDGLPVALLLCGAH